jgi:predicted dehydrogenase
VLDAAREAGVVVGCAPDTVLGTGIQTARKAIDDGLIGAPISASATMVTPGHERWHPNPDFYYQPGGGPLLDMGPYYVSALVTLLGPVVSVVGAPPATPAANGPSVPGPRAGEKGPGGHRLTRHRRPGPRFRRTVHAVHELRRREVQVAQHRDPR